MAVWLIGSPLCNPCKLTSSTARCLAACDRASGRRWPHMCSLAGHSTGVALTKAVHGPLKATPPLCADAGTPEQSRRQRVVVRASTAGGDDLANTAAAKVRRNRLVRSC